MTVNAYRFLCCVNKIGINLYKNGIFREIM